MERQIELEKAIGDGQVLVVNSTMEAKEIVSWGDAASLIYNNKAYTLLSRADGKKLCSPSVEWDWPVVVVLVKYAQKRNRIFNMEDEVSKNFIRRRDNFTCVYCGNPGHTVDHIQPKSRGGKDIWSNLCVACKKCNGFKADRTPEEAGMKRPVIKSGFVPNGKLEKVETMLYSLLAEMT